MKTRTAIEDLKQNWNSDPCWNIEETAGFEEHKKELLEYRLMVERTNIHKEVERIYLLCEKYKCNAELLRVIESLQNRITELETKPNR